MLVFHHLLVLLLSFPIPGIPNKATMWEISESSWCTLPKSKMFSPKLPPCRTKLSKGPPRTISVHNGSLYKKNSVTVNNHSLQWKGCTKLSTPEDGVQKLHTPKHRLVALHMESTRAASTVWMFLWFAYVEWIILILRQTIEDLQLGWSWWKWSPWWLLHPVAILLPNSLSKLQCFLGQSEPAAPNHLEGWMISGHETNILTQLSFIHDRVIRGGSSGWVCWWVLVYSGPLFVLWNGQDQFGNKLSNNCN